MLTWSSSYPSVHCFSDSFLAPPLSTCFGFFLIYLPSLGISSSTMISSITCVPVLPRYESPALTWLLSLSHIKMPIGLLHLDFARPFLNLPSQSQTLYLPPQFDPSSGFTTLVKGSRLLHTQDKNLDVLAIALAHIHIHSLILYFSTSPNHHLESSSLCS